MDLHIYLAPDCTYFQKRLAVELSAILGLSAYAVRFPAAGTQPAGIVITGTQRRPEGIFREDSRLVICVEEQEDSLDRICRALLKQPEYYLDLPKNPREIAEPQGYQAASDHPMPVTPSDPRPVKGLETLFEVGPFLIDTDSDWVADETRFKLLMPTGVTLSQTIAACNLAMRFGAETLGLAYPVTAQTDTGVGPVIRFSGTGEPGLTLEEAERPTVVVWGDGPRLEQFSTWLCTCFPELTQGHTWTEYICHLDESTRMGNLDGQLAMLETAQDCGPAQCWFSLEDAPLDRMKRRFPYASFTDYRSPHPVLKREMEFPWEVDHCHTLLRESVYPRLSLGDQVEIEIALSESQAIRTALVSEIRSELENIGVCSTHIRVLCAYKQGLGWISEVLLPELEPLAQELGEITIAFRPFLPPEGEQWMDLPIRFLQELYPIDDIIARQLGMEHSQVKLVQGTPEQTDTYVFRALRRDGSVQMERRYTARLAQRPYMDIDPHGPQVHPSTGYLRVTVNGDLLLDETIPTDLERVWDAYQNTVLPDVRCWMEQTYGAALTPELQPFFARLEMELWLSEPDESLPFRQDLFSSLDAFHEDLYFFGLDYFNHYGQEICGCNFNAPGLILPVIHTHKGPPKLSVTLCRQEHCRPGISVAGTALSPPWETTAHPFLQAIRWNGIHTQAVIRIDGSQGAVPFLQSYAQLLSEGMLEAGKWLAGRCDRILFQCSGAEVSADIPPAAPEAPPLSICDIDLMEDQLIDYEGYCRIIEQLKRVPGLRIWEVAKSWQGRKIYAIELLSPQTGYCSRAKRISRNPTKCVVARHHANEISSTNACFQLLRQVLLDPKYSGLADRLNLVLIPMENPDGAAIHARLQQEHPHWKFHIARFNALGREFAGEYFKDNTVHTEALAFTRVYRMWTPDLVVDNHGVPSHEWDQQFSGYTSPPYREFWLPRALLHGYFWQIDHPDYLCNQEANNQLEAAVATAIGTNPEIAAQNREWRDRYESYAHRWMPEYFPAQYCGDIISYRYRFPYLPDRYVSVSYPWLTTICFTSEVSDETAQGAYLALCAQTHLCHDLASTDLLLNSRCVYQRTMEHRAEKSICKKVIRCRPLLL